MEPKARILILWLAICCPSIAFTQVHTFHAIHTNGADGFGSSIAPHSVDHYAGYLAIGDYEDAGGSAFDIFLSWGDTCRGYNAKTRYYRTAGSNDEYASGIQIDPTGDIWVAAVSNGTGMGLNDGLLMRVDTATNLPVVFSRAYGGSGEDAFFGISLTSDGGALLLGSTNSFGTMTPDGYVVKVNSTGAVQWGKAIGGTSNDMFMDGIQTSDGGYLLVGTSFSFTSIMSLFLVKLSATGNLVFAKVVNNPSVNWCVGYSLFKTLDGGYIINGANVNGSVNPNDCDGMLMKLDAAFAVQWTKLYGGIGWDDLIDVTPTDDDADLAKDDGYLMVGYNASIGTDDDYWSVKTDITGNVQWSRAWDEGTTDNGFTSVEQISTTQGYMMVGSHNKYGACKLMAMRTKPDGSGNFTCPTPTIVPRVINATRTLSNVTPTIANATNSVVATLTAYGSAQNVNICAGDGWPGTGSCSVAPLDQTKEIWLFARASGHSVDLNWETGASGIQGFRIWMGTDPMQLEEVAAVGADERQHALASVADGVHYFQVEAIDYNGESQRSALRSVMVGRSASIWLENHLLSSGENAILHMQGRRDEQLTWQVADLNGRKILSGSAHLDGSGTCSTTIPTTWLTSGTYIVKANGMALRLIIR